MRTQKLLDGVAEADSRVLFPSPAAGEVCWVQTSFSDGGEGIVTVQGRLTSGAPWVDLETIEASGLTQVDKMQQMRVSALMTSGTAEVWFGE